MSGKQGNMSREGATRSRRTSTAACCAEYQYRLMKTLGIGAFSKVKLAVHVPTGQKVAIKIMNRNKMKDMEEKVRRELKVMKLVAHPHIVRLYEVIETPTEVYMVMEYVESGDLFDYIVLNGRLSEDESRHFFQQGYLVIDWKKLLTPKSGKVVISILQHLSIIAGVEYCHVHRVVHRDLKPENLLLDQARSSVKIADFGLSNIMRDGQFLKTSCGSPNYAAPEVIQRRWYAGPEVDVWSCGVILYAMLCGVLPFDDENISSLYRKIIDCMYMLPSHLSVEARDLITSMLKADPLHRITVAEIRRHPFFQVHLPHYISLPPNEVAHQVKQIDENILARVEKMGFDRMDVLHALLREEQSKETVAYYLLLDSRRKQDPLNHLEHDLEDLEMAGSITHPVQRIQNHNPPLALSVNPRSESVDIPKGRNEDTYSQQMYAHGGASNTDYMSQSVDMPSRSDGGGTPRSVPMSPMSPFEFSPVLESTHTRSMVQKHGPLLVPITRVMPQGDWVIGFTAEAHPRIIMEEVLKTLQELDITWKAMGAYYAKCCWVPPLPKLTNSCFSTSTSAGGLCGESPMALGSLPSDSALHENMGDVAAALQAPVKFEAQVERGDRGHLVDSGCLLVEFVPMNFLYKIDAQF